MKSNNDEHRHILEMVSHLFYVEHMNQQEISDKLFISRSQISRLLQEAREQGIVEINIHYSARRNYTLEPQLISRFGLAAAYVMSPYSDSGITDFNKRFFNMGADVIQTSLCSNMVFGITWGSSVAGVVRALRPTTSLTGVEIVQVMGSPLIENPSFDTDGLLQTLSGKLSGTPHHMPVPLMVPDLAAYEILCKDTQISSIMNLASFSDLLLTGIGTLHDVMISQHSWLGYMTPEMLTELKEKKAVGSICARFFDIDGNILDCNWNKYCMGITLDKIQKMEQVVAVAHGVEKADAILGALRGHFINILITDSETCNTIMERANQ